MNDMEKYREKIKVISFDREKNQMVEVEESKITFDDVGGMEDIKRKSIWTLLCRLRIRSIFRLLVRK